MEESSTVHALAPLHAMGATMGMVAVAATLDVAVMMPAAGRLQNVVVDAPAALAQGHG